MDSLVLLRITQNFSTCLDSKQLTEPQREKYFKKIKSLPNNFGWVVKSIDAEELSTSMLKINKYNLNLISHDAAVWLINFVLSNGFTVQEVYVDTVGDAGKYQAKLCNLFPTIEKIIVSKKADSLYPIVSAASICAKVTRDTIMHDYQFEEQGIEFDPTMGSGYPSDPATKRWLNSNVDPVFGFPNIMRFSWKTCDNILDKKAAQIDYSASDVNDPFGFKSGMSVNRFRYFSDNSLYYVTDF